MTALTDYPDFTQPVALAEQVSLLSTPGQTITAGGSVVNVATSTVSSVAIAITPPASVIGDRDILIIRWLEGAVVVDVDVVSFHDSLSYQTQSNPLLLQVPVRGTSLSLAVIGTSVAAMALAVYGSTRQLAGGTVSRQNTAPGRWLGNINSAGIGAGASTATLYIPPVSSRIRIDTTVFAATWTFLTTGVCLIPGINVRAIYAGKANGTEQWSHEFYAPQTALEFVATNTSAGALPITINAWDVS